MSITTGGSGDFMNAANPHLKLRAPEGFVRIAHVSADPVHSTVYNFEDNKNAYWGEPSDKGTYVFRGRDMLIEQGSIGIGTTKLTEGNSNCRLSVNGKVRASEVKVYTSWADDVFYPDYKLRSLLEVESFIKENQHLPDVPSASEVEKAGVNLGEMEATLLRKIEELTLYMIELKKENEQQAHQIEQLRAERKNKQ
jgi:hypothetical protein